MKLLSGSVLFLFLMMADTSWGQGIGVIPDGVMLDSTPVVSADGRYVRVGVNAGFSTVNGFQTFPVPAAVSGGGAVGFGAGSAQGSNAANNGCGLPYNPGYDGGQFGPSASFFARGPVDFSMGSSAFGQSFSAYLQGGNSEPAFVAQPRRVKGKLVRNASKPELKSKSRKETSVTTSTQPVSR